MAEPETNPSSAEERQKRIEEKTSFGQYSLIKLKDLAIAAAGIGVGIGAGFALFKSPKIVESVQKFLPKLTRGQIAEVPDLPLKAAFMTAGGAAGSLVSGVALGYGNWKNGEAEKRAVEEINRDAGNLVTERAKFADTLKRQENVIQDLISKRAEAGDTHTERAVSSEAAANEKSL